MSRYIKRLAALALALCAAFSLCGCGADERHDAQAFAMDTVVGISAYGPDAEAGIAAAEGVINALDAMLDPEREGSAAWNINHSSENGGAVVTGQVTELLRRRRASTSVRAAGLTSPSTPSSRPGASSTGITACPARAKSKACSAASASTSSASTP